MNRNNTDQKSITFKDFLALGGYLYVNQAGYSAYINATIKTKHFNTEDIIEVDPRLIPVINAIQSHSGKVYATWLKTTMSLWENAKEIQSKDGVNYSLMEVSDILAFQKYSKDIVELSIRALCYRQPSYVEDIPYVRSTTSLTLNLDGRELEQHFPGWCERYELLKEINPDRSQLMAVVFPTTTNLAEDLPPTFDIDF